jgi:hypothetical protein
MAGQFRLARGMGPGRAEDAGDGDGQFFRLHGSGRLCGQFQADLPPTHEFDVELRQQFRVQQGAVLGAMAPVDAIARAQRIQ